MKAKLIAGGLLILTIGLIAGALAVGSRPSKGTIIHYQPSSPTTPSRPDTLTLKGSNFSLTYPGIYGSDDASKIDPKALEQHKLTADTTYPKVLVITIVPLTGSLREESSYNLRVHYPDKYHHRTATGPSGTADIFAAVDNTEEVIYFTRGGKLAILAMTTAGARDNLDAEADKLVKTFEWVK